MKTKSAVDFREIARLEAGNSVGLLPVIEKELIHYDILRAMSENGFLENLCFQGGTSLRLCYGSERFSEDLDFTGGVGFDYIAMSQLKECIEDSLSARYGLSVTVKPPKEKSHTGVKVSSWQVNVITAPDRPDIRQQKIKIEVGNVPSYTRELVQISDNYKFSTHAPLVIAVQSMDEIMADKLLALPVSISKIRNRDIWDLHWMSLNRIKPNSELLKHKIADYGVVDYQEKLIARIEGLPGIVNGSDFINEMSRFLKNETINNTLSNESFKTALIGNVARLLLTNLEAETLLTRYNAVPASGEHRGVVVDVSDLEVVQHTGRGKHVVWDKAILSGEPIVIGSSVYISKNGEVSVIKSKGIDK